MAYSACAPVSSLSVPTSRFQAAPNSSSCASTSNWCTSSVISFKNGKATPSVGSLSWTSGQFSNLANSDRGLTKLRTKYSRSVRYSEKRRNDRWFVAQAVSTGTAESAEAEASEESASQLLDKLLSLVKDTDRGALLGPEEQGNVADVVGQLEKMGMPEPLKSPLIFGDWNVAYSSNPTSPGGGYRTWLGRLIFRTRDMIQTIIEPDGVVNVVRFALFGFILGEVTLRGKITPLDSKMIQVDFEPPKLQIGPARFSYGRMSMVKISITYLDKDIRLGKGSRGTVFVFTRR